MVDIGTPLYVAVIADVVGSRSAPNQLELFRQVEEMLDEINSALPATLPLALSVGDEFQGLYPDIASALHATLLVALQAKGRFDVRFGLGMGAVEVLDELSAPRRQSGPAWWAARRAIEETRRTRNWPKGLGSWLEAETGTPSGLVNALLLYRDQVVSGMDATDAAVALGLLAGKKQIEIASELGLSQSSVSARQRRNGPAALLRAWESLSQVSKGRASWEV